MQVQSSTPLKTDAARAKASAATRRWIAANRDYHRLLIRLAGHRRRQAEGRCTPDEWLALCSHYGNRCLACNRDDLPLTVDHIVPISKGGTNWPDNLQPLCWPCNQRKHVKIIDYRPDAELSDWERMRSLRPPKTPLRIDAKYEWVNVSEASQRLGVSLSTVRRMVESGQLVGEREPLGRGSNRDRYLVRFDREEMPQDASPFESEDESSEAPETPTDASALTGRALDIMDALLRANGETMERQAETIAALRERVGRLDERATAAEARAKAAEETLTARSETLRAAEADLERITRRSLWSRILNRD